ncbi:MAG TPA: methylenetetrahydrofolate reductase [Xanthomonadales bacterium]|nr:methylenetetrahydrofolate reductase [Xanthomonadales bacterium]
MKQFRDAIRTQPFTLTADLTLGRGTDAAQVKEQARLLGSVFDAIQVPDSHDGRLQMSGQAAAVLLLGEGVDPLVHVTGRDRNRIALENDLLGLAVLGVTSVLLTRGEELPPTYKPAARHVFELSGEDLVTTARLMGEDESIPGAGSFFIGTAATLFNPKANWQPRALTARVDAGAGFIQTQICFNMKALGRYLARLVEARLTWRCAIMAGVAVLPNAAAARLLKDNLHGAVVPEKIIRRLEQAQDPELEGIRICAETLQKMQEIPGISGANLMTPGDPQTIVEAIRLSGLRP